MFAATDVFRPLSHPPPPTVRPSLVMEQVRRRLHESAYPLHRYLRCSFCDGVLTLHGRVSSYYLRQTALAMLVEVQGVEEIVDRIEVTGK